MLAERVRHWQPGHSREEQGLANNRNSVDVATLQREPQDSKRPPAAIRQRANTAGDVLSSKNSSVALLAKEHCIREAQLAPDVCLSMVPGFERVALHFAESCRAGH